MLEQLQQLTENTLANPLTLAIVELERDLMRSADVARNSQLQMELMGQARHVLPLGQAFSRAYLDECRKALLPLREPHQRDTAAPAPLASQLSLVQDSEIDRSIVLQDLARREAPRHNTALHLLSQRMAVLGGRPAFDIEQVPLSPHWLCRRLPSASAQLELSNDASLLLYKAFGRLVLERQADLLEQANSLLARNGVLPGLVHQPFIARQGSRRRTAPAEPPAAGNSARGSQPDAGPHADASPSAARPLTQWQGQGPAASWRESLHEAAHAPEPLQPAQALTAAVSEEDLADLQQMLSAARQAYGGQLPSAPQLPLGAMAAPAGLPPPGAPVPATTAAAPADIAPSPAAPGPPGTVASAPAHALPRETVGSILSRLQGLSAEAPVNRNRSIEDIRDALVAQGRADHGPQAGLSPQDNDTLDLLGLLYRQIQAHMRASATANELLTQLQLPVVRAAISDPGFFVREQHPARELLNAVAESGAAWLGNEDVDPVLVQKLGQTVQKVVSDYDGDEQVFEAATEEIQGHYRSAVHKAELSERRFVEAARGKERLEAARQLAERTIEQACKAEPAPPRFVQNLMRQAWTDVLMLTLLRQGEQSAEWRQRVAATARIVELTGQSAGRAADTTFGDELESALSQVGYHDGEASAIARRLSTPGGEDDQTSKTELTARLQARSRLGDQGNALAQASAAEAAQPPRTPAEEDCYLQLRSLQFGTWFDFHTNQQGDTRRLRMSWFSQLTGNALFVNARGQKVAEHTLDNLARRMAAGQLHIVTESQGRLIDRAWQATLRTLRSLAGKSASKEPS